MCPQIMGFDVTFQPLLKIVHLHFLYGHLIRCKEAKLIKLSGILQCTQITICMSL